MGFRTTRKLFYDLFFFKWKPQLNIRFFNTSNTIHPLQYTLSQTLFYNLSKITQQSLILLPKPIPFGDINQPCSLKLEDNISFHLFLFFSPSFYNYTTSNLLSFEQVVVTSYFSNFDWFKNNKNSNPCSYTLLDAQNKQPRSPFSFSLICCGFYFHEEYPSFIL